MIVFVIASHGRTDIVLQNVEHLLTFGEVVLIVSDEQEFELYERKTDAYVFIAPNEPLGAKWQKGFDMARKLEPDLVIPCGSDDILSCDYITKAEEILNKGFDFVGVNGWYMSDGKRHFRAKYKHRQDFPAGSGRVFTKKCLDAIDWDVFDKKLNRLLDDKALIQMKAKGVNTYISQGDQDGLKVLALKGDWDMLNPLDKFLHAPTIRILRLHRLPKEFPKIKL